MLYVCMHSDLEPIQTAFQLVIICLDFNNATVCIYMNYTKLYSNIGLIQWLPIIIGVAVKLANVFKNILNIVNILNV